MIETGEILQTLRMIQEENFDIRTITLGINLLDCSDADPAKCADRVYDKICLTAKDLVPTGEAIEREFGIPIVNKRISVTPVSLICQGDPRPVARALDRAAKETGVNFLGGYSALMHKGATLADERLLASIPDMNQDKSKKLQPIPGSPPDMIHPPKGCPLAPRCAYAMRICAEEMPPYVKTGENRRSMCWLLDPEAPENEIRDQVSGIRD